MGIPDTGADLSRLGGTRDRIASMNWTQGAGVVKALHPFCKLGGRHRTFLEVHLAKSRRVNRELRKLGWRVVRIWEHSLKGGGGGSIKRIKRTLL